MAENAGAVKRLDSLDIGKGIAILGVVLYHTTMIISQCELALTLLMTCFLMPFFFWAAGYNYKSGRSAGANIKRRVLPLLKIYIIYSVGLLAVPALIFGLSGMADPVSIRNQIVTHFAGKPLMSYFAPELVDEGLLWSMAAPLWYLVQLILGSILFYLVAEAAMKSLRNALITVVILFAVTALLTAFCPAALPFNLQSTPALTAYMILGAICGKAKFLQKLANVKTGLLWVLIIVFGAIQTVLAWFFPDGDQLSKGYFSMDPNTHVIAIFVVLLQSVTGIISFMSFCTLLEKTALRKVLAWLGRNTLPYYLLHMEILMLLSFALGVMDEIGNVGPALLGKLFAVLVITLGICTLWAIVENKIKEKKKQRRTA